MQIEIAIEAQKDALMRLRRALDREGPGVVYAHRGMDGPRPEIVFLESENSVDGKLRAISRIVRRLEKDPPQGGMFAFRVRNLAYAEPGAAVYREAFSPIPSIRIQPWCPAGTPVPDPGTVVLAGENAFGNGKHPSSRLCLQFLDSMSPGKEGAGGEVLDFGCGTGLLAIAAVLLGYGKALGVEIDSQAVQTAKKNVSMNRLENRIIIRQGSWDEVHGKFDLILANLVPSVLLRTGRNIPKHLKAGGCAVVAGFSRNQMQDMERFFRDAGLITQKRMTLDGWGLLGMIGGK